MLLHRGTRCSSWGIRIYRPKQLPVRYHIIKQMHIPGSLFWDVHGVPDIRVGKKRALALFPSCRGVLLNQGAHCSPFGIRVYRPKHFQVRYHIYQATTAVYNSKQHCHRAAKRLEMLARFAQPPWRCVWTMDDNGRYPSTSGFASWGAMVTLSEFLLYFFNFVPLSPNLVICMLYFTRNSSVRWVLPTFHGCLRTLVSHHAAASISGSLDYTGTSTYVYY